MNPCALASVFQVVLNKRLTRIAELIVCCTVHRGIIPIKSCRGSGRQTSEFGGFVARVGPRLNLSRTERAKQAVPLCSLVVFRWLLFRVEYLYQLLVVYSLEPINSGTKLSTKENSSSKSMKTLTAHLVYGNPLRYTYSTCSARSKKTC